MDNTLRWMHKTQGQQVFRARFSAITAPEIRAAMVRASLIACRQDLTFHQALSNHIHAASVARKCLKIKIIIIIIITIILLILIITTTMSCNVRAVGVQAISACSSCCCGLVGSSTPDCSQDLMSHHKRLDEPLCVSFSRSCKAADTFALCGQTGDAQCIMFSDADRLVSTAEQAW